MVFFACAALFGWMRAALGFVFLPLGRLVVSVLTFVPFLVLAFVPFLVLLVVY